MNLNLAWDISDTFNGLMAIPNLIGVLTLSGTVIRITKNYSARTFHGSTEKPMLSAFEDREPAPERDMFWEIMCSGDNMLNKMPVIGLMADNGHFLS